MEISQKGLNLIKRYEGCVLHPYLDQGGTPTIGWGMTYYPNTGKKVSMNDATLTQEQADTYFLEMVQPYCNAVLEVVTVPLTQNQLDALTDFSYNLGNEAFRQSTLLQHINNHAVVEEDFTIYSHANGKVLVGLLNRRKAEYTLFITADTPTITMEENTAPTADITPSTEQTVKLTKVMVYYDKTANGETIQGEAEIPVTPEIVAIFKQVDVLPGYDVIVTE